MRNALPVFLLYGALINISAAAVTAWDKFCAIHRRRRVSERTLLLLAALGGSIFMLLTMLLIRHKTRKPKFMIGIPLIILLHTLLLGSIFYLKSSNGFLLSFVTL